MNANVTDFIKAVLMNEIADTPERQHTGLSPHSVLLNLNKPIPVCPLRGKNGKREKERRVTGSSWCVDNKSH